MKGILPDEILYRPKMGFPVPMARWLRNEFKQYVDEYILSERALNRGIFDADFARELVGKHDKGEDHSNRLFRLINFEMWYRIFIEGEKLF
jgi:asparagine synthase (glutamine-hydrolysing)